MAPASDLVKFEVGDGKARGFPEGRADPSVYRDDIREIDAPDATYIAMADPQTILALLDALQGLEREVSDLRAKAIDRADHALGASLAYREQIMDLEDVIQAQDIQGNSRIGELEAALAWYGEQARLARLIHSEGDKGRHALSDDGGKRARALLQPTEPSDDAR